MSLLVANAFLQPPNTTPHIGAPHLSERRMETTSSIEEQMRFQSKRFDSSHISTHMLRSWHQSQCPSSSPNATHYIAHRLYSFIRNANVNSTLHRRINAILVGKELILRTFRPLSFVVGINPRAPRAPRMPHTILHIGSTHLSEMRM